jgi:hypothetical protein
VPCQRAYEHLGHGMVMTMQFDKECQHDDGEHVEFGRSVPETSEEGLRLFNPRHIGIVVTVPPYERNNLFRSEHTRTWLGATVPLQGNQHPT